VPIAAENPKAMRTAFGETRVGHRTLFATACAPKVPTANPTAPPIELRILHANRLANRVSRAEQLTDDGPADHAHVSCVIRVELGVQAAGHDVPPFHRHVLEADASNRVPQFWFP